MLMSTYFKVFPGVIVDVDVVVVVFNWHTSIIIQLTIAKGMIRQIFDAISLLLTDSLKHIHHQLNNNAISNIFCRVFSNILLVTLGQFHQRVYGQLLRLLILKVQKAAWVECLFFAFGIYMRKSCFLKMLVKSTLCFGALKPFVLLFCVIFFCVNRDAYRSWISLR